MADNEGGPVLGAGAEALAGGGGGEAGGESGGGGGESGAAPEWLGTLPDDLKADATLTRYADIEALARGHLETKKLATSRLALPGEGASDEDWGKFYDAAGRPKEAGAYDLGLPALPDDAGDAAKAAHEGMVKAYQEKFHAVGLNPKQAAALARADLARIEAATAAHYAKGDGEIAALKAELGAEYEPRKEAARKMFLSLFGEDATALADELDTKVGSGRLMKGMMKLAKVAGEHVRVDGDGDPLVLGGDPAEQLRTLNKDAGWREKFKTGDAAAVAQERKLRAAAMDYALKRGSAD